MKQLLQISLLISACLYTTCAQAQFRFNQPIKLTEENGLPTNTTRQIKLDDNGFVWIATNEGVCRFDGQTVKTYQHDPKDSTSIIGSQVNAIASYNNEIWIGAINGISVLDPTTQKFRHYQINGKGKANSIQRTQSLGAQIFYKDKHNDLWIGTRTYGVFRYDKKTDNFIPFQAAHDIPPIFPFIGTYNNILSIEGHISNDSIIWAGSSGGLLEINKFTGGVRSYSFPHKNTDYMISMNAMRRLYHHSNGLLYAGSWNAGVHVFDPVKKTFTPLPVGNDDGKQLLRDAVYAIVKNNDSSFWVTTTGGVLLYNTVQNKISFFKQNNQSKEEFYGVEYVDRFNRIWLSTIRGVLCFNPLVQQFSTYPFNHLYGDKWGYAFYIEPGENGSVLTVCPRQCNGLYQFDKDKESWTKLSFNNLRSLNFDKLVARGFERISANEFIISADEGLFRYRKNSGTLEQIPEPKEIKYSRWGDVLYDHSGNLWICAAGEALIRRNLATGAEKFFSSELKGNDDVSIQPNNLFEDSNNNIWFSIPGGYGVYIANHETVLRFASIKSDAQVVVDVTAFAEDKHHRVWILHREGLAYASSIEPQQGILKKIQPADKNIHESITDLAADNKGNVWGYTGKYLFKVSEGTSSWNFFSFKYGMIRPDFYHFSFTPSGEFVFGGRNSITIGYPAKLEHNNEIPVPYIDKIEKLHQKENFFNIHYSAIAFNLADEVQFRYRLKGFEEWKTSKGKGIATYTNVPPGDYVFQLQAANNEGSWNDKFSEIAITIPTPFWLTWWFILAVMTVLVLVARFVYKLRIAEVKKKEQLRSQYEKKLANVEMSALLAQMNPHFLFNSLNSIDSYIIKNETAKASGYLNNFARLMRLILQHSRSNYISLKDEIETLELYLEMEALRLGNRFNYSLSVNPGLDTSSVLLPPMLLQPYIENAIWHGLVHKKSEQGKLKIDISKKDSSLNCVIEDNGIGRDMAMTLNRQKWGNLKPSMGMQITRDRIEIINKLYNTNTRVEIIDLKDEAGQPAGTRVQLIIPV